MIRVARTEDLTQPFLDEIKRLCELAYGEPFVEDWDHALGGTHFVVVEGGAPVCHASVVERLLEAGGLPLRTGYVEAVATHPGRRRRGLAGTVIEAASAHIREGFALGGLCTGENSFYARFGWETWRGPTYVLTDAGPVRTAGEDGNVMVLRTPRTPALDLAGPIVCDDRPGDVW